MPASVLERLIEKEDKPSPAPGNNFSFLQACETDAGPQDVTAGNGEGFQRELRSEQYLLIGFVEHDEILERAITLFLSGLSLIEQQTSYRVAEQLAQSLMDTTLRFSGDRIVDVLKAAHESANRAAFADAITALGALETARLPSDVVDYLNGLRLDLDPGVAQAAQDTLDLIAFASEK